MGDLGRSVGRSTVYASHHCLHLFALPALVCFDSLVGRDSCPVPVFFPMNCVFLPVRSLEFGVSLLLGGMLFAVAFFILVLHLLPTCVVRASGSSTHSLRLPICVSSCVTVSRRLSHVAMPSHNLESPLWQALKVPSILPPCFLQSSLVSGVRSGARHPLPSRLTPLAPFPSGLRPTSFASGLLPLPPASTLPLCVRHGSLLLRVRPDALLSCGLFFENGY